MQITINIDPNFPRWLKRVAMYAGIPAAVTVAAAVYADVTVPNTFGGGQALSAAKMNANFSVLQDGINGLSGTVQQLQTSTGSLASRPQSFSAHILASGARKNPKGDWIQSSERVGTPGMFSYLVNFQPGTFASAPNCTCSITFENSPGCGGDSICNVSVDPTTDGLRLSVTTVSAAPGMYVGNCSMSLICNG